MVLVRQPFYNRKEWANLPENPEGLEQKTGSCIQMQKKRKKLCKKACQTLLNVVLYVSAKR